VLRVRVAITEIKPSSPVSNTMSSIIPVGMVVVGVTKAVRGDNFGTGEAATEMALLNSQTGELLAAAVDRRQGGKRPSAANGKTPSRPLTTGPSGSACVWMRAGD